MRDGSAEDKSIGVCLDVGSILLRNRISNLSSSKPQADQATTLYADPWRSMVVNSALAIARLKLDGHFVDVSPAYQNLVGYSEEELREIKLSDLVREEDGGAHEDFIQQLHSGERSHVENDVRYRRKDGEIIWVHNIFSRVANDAATTGFAVCIAENIRGRKLAEESLKKQNEALKMIFDHVPVMISFASSDGSVRLVNPEWERTLGWSNEELITDNPDVFAHCFPDPDRRREAKKFVANGPCRWTEFKPRTKDGRLIDTVWAEVNLSDGTSICIGRDITAQKQAEEALRRSEAYLAESQRLSHMGSWAYNIAQASPFWSAEHFRIFEFEPNNEPVSMDAIRNRIHPEDLAAFDRVVHSMRHGNQDFVIDLRIILPDGSIKFVRSIGHVVLDEHDQAVEYTGTIMDVTERKLAEQERQRSFDQLRALTARLQSAREEERTRVAREIHDELGQALTSIKIDFSSWVHELPGEHRRTERIDRILEMIDQTIKSVRRIATELRPGILDDLGLLAAIEWAAEQFETRTGTKCRPKLPELNLPFDRERDTALFRILQETLTNVARHAEATCVDIHLTKDSESVRLKVCDNGRGITLEQLSAPSSLGIRGMRERVLLLGGELAVSSSPGEGTTVLATVPLESNKAGG